MELEPNKSENCELQSGVCDCSLIIDGQLPSIIKEINLETNQVEVDKDEIKQPVANNITDIPDIADIADIINKMSPMSFIFGNSELTPEVINKMITPELLESLKSILESKVNETTPLSQSDDNSSMFLD
jgi:hypothetical protein